MVSSWSNLFKEGALPFVGDTFSTVEYLDLGTASSLKLGTRYLDPHWSSAPILACIAQQIVEEVLEEGVGHDICALRLGLERGLYVFIDSVGEDVLLCLP